MRRPGAKALPALLAIVLTVGACGAPATAPSASGGLGPPSGASPAATNAVAVDEALDDLAEAGVEVFATPADAAPVRAAAGPRSPLRLLRSQVENLAREAAAGGGIGADQIDDLLPMPAESIPFSFILAGYVAASDTPGAARARELMADQDLEQPAALLFPTLVLTLFIGEVTAASAAPTTGSAPALLTGAAPTQPTSLSPALGGLVASVDGPPPPIVVRPAAAGPCADLPAFFASTLQQLASVIVSVVPDIPFLRAAITWALTKGIALGLDAAINLIERIPFINALRSAIGTLALAITVVAAIRDWTVKVESTPALAHYAVGPSVSGADVVGTVDDGPGDVFTPEVRTCANLLKIQLPKGGAAGSDATWRIVAGAEHATRSGGAGPAPVDASRRTSIRLVMTREPDALHESDRIANGLVVVRVTVKRQDVDQVRKVIEGAITGAIPAPVYSALTGLFGDPLGKIAAMTDITGQGRLVAEYHLPAQTPPPEPSPTPAQALRVHLERPAFAMVEAGTLIDLVSCDGPYGTWKGVFRAGGLTNEVGMSVVDWYERPVQFTVGGGSGKVTVHVVPPTITVNSIAGPIVIDEEVDVTVDGKTMTVAGDIDGQPMKVSLPIEKGPASGCPGR